MLLRVVVVLVLSLSVVGSALAAPPDPSADACRYAEDRAEASLLRARRAAARVNIAALRVVAELGEVGRKVPTLDKVILEAPLREPTGSLQEKAELAWDLKEYAARVGARSEAVMDELLRPPPDPSHLGPTLEDDERELWRPRGERVESCLAWAYYVERAAFRADQAAQLADVAADQAIALSDHELRNRGR